MQECRWFRKKSICSVALQLRRCGAPISAPHSSVFARLASGAFYETIVSVTFYEITIIEFRDLAIRDDFTSSRGAWVEKNALLSFPGRWYSKKGISLEF